jgi:hypothetical protein
VKKFLLACLLLVSTPALAYDIRISELDPGGNIGTYHVMYARWAESKDKLVIDAPCISACTIFLRYIGEAETDRVCITERGTLGLHQASTPDGGHDPVLTTMLVRAWYPKWVQKWIVGVGGLAGKIKIMYPEDTKGYIPLCSGSSYSDVDPDGLIEKEDEKKPEVSERPNPKDGRQIVKPPRG